MCGRDTETVGENGAQICLLVILGPLGKMDQTCVFW